MGLFWMWDKDDRKTVIALLRSRRSIDEGWLTRSTERERRRSRVGRDEIDGVLLLAESLVLTGTFGLFDGSEGNDTDPVVINGKEADVSPEVASEWALVWVVNEPDIMVEGGGLGI